MEDFMLLYGMYSRAKFVVAAKSPHSHFAVMTLALAEAGLMFWFEELTRVASSYDQEPSYLSLAGVVSYVNPKRWWLSPGNERARCLAWVPGEVPPGRRCRNKAKFGPHCRNHRELPAGCSNAGPWVTQPLQINQPPTTPARANPKPT